MRAPVDNGAGDTEAGRIDAGRIAEEIGACGFEARKLRSRVEVLANHFDLFARAAEKSQMGFCATDVAGQDQTIHTDLAMPASSGSIFHFELLGQRDFLDAADVDRMPLMNRGRSKIEYPRFAGRTAPAGLLRKHREWCKFVQKTELALGLATLSDFARIHVDSTFEQASMEIRGERAAVSKRVTGALVHPAGDLGEKFARSVVPLSRVALVHRVSAAMRRHLYVFFPEDEFAEAAVEREDIDAVARGVNQLRARAIQDVSRDDLRASRHEEILDAGAVALRTLLHGEDRAERSVYICVRGSVDRIVEYAVAIVAAVG